MSMSNFRAVDMPGASKAEPVKEAVKKTPAPKKAAGGTKTVSPPKAAAPKATDGGETAAAPVDTDKVSDSTEDSSKGASNE